MFNGMGLLKALKSVNVAVFSGAGTVLVYDTFTGADGTLLTAHAPDINLSGNPYVELEISGAGTRTKNHIRSNAAATDPAEAAANAIYASCIDTVVSNVMTTAQVFRPVTAAAGNGLAIRASDASNLWRTDFSNALFRILERSGGVNTVRASSAVAPVLGNVFEMTLTGTGTAITSTLEGPGVSLTTLNYSSSFNQSATSHGLVLQSLSNNPYIEDLEIVST